MRRAPLLLFFTSTLAIGCADAPPPTPTSATPVAVAPTPDLPFASNVWAPLADAPTIAIERGRVLVDGAVVGDARAIEAAGRMQKVDGEFEALRLKREAWKAAHAGAPFPGAAVLELRRDTSARVVKSLFQTAAFAGYPNLSFAVVTGAPPVVARVEVDAEVPAPPDGREQERALGVRIAPSAPVTLSWTQGGALVSQVDVPLADAFDRSGAAVRAPGLASKVSSEWAAQGQHRDPSDAKLDRAVIEVDDAVPLGDLVAVLDALHGTKRALAGGARPMPAFAVTLSPRSATPPPEEAKPPPRAGGPKIAVGSVTAAGRLPPEVVQRIVRKNFRAFTACYASGLERRADLAGRVVIRFVIGKDGKISQAGDAEATTLKDAKAHGCILAAFSRLEFPPPEGGTVTVTYPLEFSPGDAPPKP
ncbi:MAG TPA: AgmX/PglI C-terminal domain-containing protein [Byssovorax sp.]